MEKDLKYWYRQKESLRHLGVTDYIDRLAQEQSTQSFNNSLYLRMYGGVDNESIPLRKHFDISATNKKMLGINVIQSNIDTVTAKIAKNKPRPIFHTSNADWPQQVLSEKLNDIVEGIFYATDLYRKGEYSLLTSCILGTGLIKWWIEEVVDKKQKKESKTKKYQVKCESVLADELKIKYEDGMYGTPSEMHQIKLLSKEKLKGMYPEFKKEIDSAENCMEFGIYKYNSEDMVRVVESWRLPDAINPNGVHCKTIGTCTLETEDWNKDYFPFAVLRWNQRPLGFTGQGICEQLLPIQYEINKTMKRIQLCIHLAAVPKLFVEHGSRVNLEHLNNQIGGIVQYTGVMPKEGQMGSVPPQLLEYLQFLINKSFELTGVSQMSAYSKSQLSPDASGAAMNELYQIESERFQSQGMRYENFYLDSAKIVIKMVNEIYNEKNGTLDLTIGKGAKYETIEWGDLNLDKEMIYLKVFSASILPKTPAGRRDEIERMMNSGLLTPKLAMKLLDIPDIESEMNLENAPYINILWTISEMCEGRPQVPEELQDLNLGIKYVTNAYLLYSTKKMPDENLELMRNWIDEAKALMDVVAQQEQELQMQAQMAAQGGMDGGMPQV